MVRIRTYVLIGVAVFIFALSGLPALAAPREAMEGQKPMMVIGDVFQFVPGSWGVYRIHDRVKKEHYRMYIATLEKTKVNGKACSWMEVEVTPEKASPVASRFLVEETKDGPGELLEVVVQVKGFAPFIVPQKTL